MPQLSTEHTRLEASQHYNNKALWEHIQRSSPDFLGASQSRSLPSSRCSYSALWASQESENRTSQNKDTQQGEIGKSYGEKKAARFGQDQLRNC